MAKSINPRRGAVRDNGQGSGATNAFVCNLSSCALCAVAHSCVCFVARSSSSDSLSPEPLSSDSLSSGGAITISSHLLRQNLLQDMISLIRGVTTVQDSNTGLISAQEND